MTIVDIDAALSAKLLATATVTALVSTRIYGGQAPAKTALPYIVFNSASGLFDNTTPHQDVNHVYRVAAVATTRAAAYAIIAACHDALHHNSLSLSGWRTFMVVQENIITLVDNLEGTQIYRVIADFRIRASVN